MESDIADLGGQYSIDARGLDHRALALRMRDALRAGASQLSVYNVCGQRYIGTGLREAARVDLYGTPGNDLASFMRGPTIYVHGNAQDGCGNTLDGGTLVVYGHAGDILGYAMRGGKIFVRDSVGYRAGIHMKEYKDVKPAIVIGGDVQPFLGEYMAGGTVIVLRLNAHRHATRQPQSFVGTGMHGGAIYLRGEIASSQLGREVAAVPVDDIEADGVADLVREFCGYFDYNAAEVLSAPFIKIYPKYLRPYGRLYAY